MPEMAHKTIFQHWFEAIQDTTLLILCAAAVVSIGMFHFLFSPIIHSLHNKWYYKKVKFNKNNNHFF